MNKQQYIMKLTVERVIIGILIAFMVSGGVRRCQDAKEIKILEEQLDDTIKVWKNKLGQSLTQIGLLSSEKQRTFTKLRSKDSMINVLQEEVKKLKLSPGGSVTIIQGKTQYDTVYKPQYIALESLIDSPVIDSISNKWIKSKFGFKFKALSNNRYAIDSTYFRLDVVNDYIVTIDTKKNDATITVKSLNPYSTTTGLRSYQRKLPSPPRFSLGAFIGPGVLLSEEPKAGLVAGAGLNYKF